MATVTVTELYPHPGQIWARLVQLWETYIATPAWSWGALSMTAVNGHRAATQTINDGTDNVLYQLVDCNTISSDRMGMPAFFSLPNISKSPKFMPTTVGARTPASEFGLFGRTNRQPFVANWIGGSNLTGQSASNSVNVGITVTATIEAIVYTVQLAAHADVLILTTGTVTSAVTNSAEANLADEPVPGSLTSYGGTGGAVDSAGIIAALNDIALIDVEYTANNGGAIWSMRGKVRTS